MRATCTLARLPPINDPEIAEALEDVGLEDVGYEPDMTQELLAALEALLGDVRETTLHWKMVHDPMAVPSMRAALRAISKAKGDMTQPNFRCITYGNGTYVEVPAYWRDRVTNQQTQAIVQALIDQHGKASPIYAEGVAEAFNNHRARTKGYLIPIRVWDDAFRGLKDVGL